jgi:RND family efflux transporter MFP subunit
MTSRPAPVNPAGRAEQRGRDGATPAPLASAAALALGLLLSGCSGKHPTPPPPPPTVVVSPPLIQQIVDWDDYVGHFEAQDSVEIRPRVSGYLVRVAFRDGEFVRKGQLLFEIDPRPYQAALGVASAQVARTRATLENARVELKRATALYAAKAISQQELSTREAAEAQAAADLAASSAVEQTARLNLGFTRVTSPISGRISDRRIATGNLVNADQTVLTTVVSMNPIRFVFTGAESVYLKYQRANENGSRPSSRRSPNPVAIRLQDETDYRWKGRMDFVDNALDTGSGTIRGRAVVPNPDNFLTPGMFGHLRLLGSGAYSGMVVPDQAIVTDQSRLVVYVVGGDSVISQKIVETGPLINGLRVIRHGLTATDRVVIDGVQRAKPGRKVKAIPGSIAPPPPVVGPTPAPVQLAPSRSATNASSVH